MATANTRVSLTVDVHTNLRRSPVPSCSPQGPLQHQHRVEQELVVSRNAAGSSCSDSKHVPQSPKSESQQGKDGSKKKRVNRTATAKLKQCKLGVRREQWLAQVAGKQGKFDQAQCLPDLDSKDIVGTGESSGQEVMQKPVGAGCVKVCTEDGFSTEDSDNECPVAVSTCGCCASEGKLEQTDCASLQAQAKVSESQVWRELHESETMPRSIPNQGRPKFVKRDKVGNSGGRRGEVSSSRGERPCSAGDNFACCNEHGEHFRYQNRGLEEAVAGLCSLSVNSHSPPVRGRENGNHKGGGGEQRGRSALSDRAVNRSKFGSRDTDLAGLSGVAAGDNDPSRRKVGGRKQVVPDQQHGNRAKAHKCEEFASSAPPRAGPRPSLAEEGGVGCAATDDVPSGMPKKAGGGQRSRSADGASAATAAEEEVVGATSELKPNGNDATVWSTSDGGSTSHSGRSSGSSSSSYAGSGSEEDNEGHHDPEDDWETAADALYTQSMYRNSGEGKGKGYKSDALHQGGKDTLEKKSHGFSSSELQHPGALKPEYKYKSNGFGGRMRGSGGRAWRPDDVSRPPTLPRLTKQQHNYTMQSAQGVWGPVHGNMWGPPATPSYCPICTEELDMTDSSFVPCSCGFRLCLFCHHRIASEDGRCPGCRKAYNSDVAMKLSRASSMWLRA